MALSGIYSCLKYFVFFVNLIFWLLGVLVLGVALWFYFDSIHYLRAFDEHNVNSYYIGTYILMGTGAVIMIIGFLGCCGAFRESQCMLGTFFVFMLVIITAQIAGGVLGWINQKELHNPVKNSFIDSVQKTYSKDKTTTEAVDFIQKTMGCCGANNPRDWVFSEFNDYKRDSSLVDTFTEVGVTALTRNYNVPGSCCNKEKVDECSEDPIAVVASPMEQIPDEIYHDGCSDKFIEFLESNRIYAVSVGIGVAVIEFLGVILSLVLCCAIRRVEQFKA